MDTFMDTRPSQPPALAPSSEVALPVVHPRYQEARQRAVQLETHLDTAQKQYADELQKIIVQMQRKFYAKHGVQLQELEDLEEGIQNIQYKGYKQLKRALTKLYIEDDGTRSKEDTRQQVKAMTRAFRTQYMPDDEYQRRRDREAARLQNSILGSIGVGGSSKTGERGGGGGSHSRFLHIE